MARTTLLLCTMLVAAAALGQQPPTYEPAPAPRRPLTLKEAVAVALAHDAAVAQARALKLFNAGLWRQQRGVFDEVVTLSAFFERETLPIPTGVRNNELGRRRLLRTLAITFEGLANGIQQQLDSGIFGPLPECVETTLTVGATVTEIHCLPPSVFIDLEALLRGSEDAGLPEAVQAVRDVWRRQLETFLATSRFVAFVGRQLLRQQGVAPTIEDRDTLSYSLGLSRLFRNGMLLEPQVEFAAVRDTWRGKPLDPSFGGKGVLVSYRSQFGFTLDVPVGRGGGLVSAQAGERAAAKQADAAVFQEAAALQSAALRTTLAYYNTAAAKERAALLAQAVQREEHLLEVAKGLVEGDELAPAELVLLSARLAQARSQLAQAQQGYLQAQRELALHMGLAANALDELPEVAEELPSALAQEALSTRLAEVEQDQGWLRRPEPRAAQLAKEAAATLAAGARADLRRDVRLVFTAFYNGLHESPKTISVSRFWPDASKAWGEGFAGPSVAVSLQFALPFANSFARGRLATSLALESQAAVRLADLRRTIGLRAREAWRRAEERQRELAARLAGVAAAESSLQAAQELFRAGELSVVDLIVTEEALITAQLALVDARLSLATAAAQLDFELGRLLPVRVVGTSVVVGEG